MRVINDDNILETLQCSRLSPYVFWRRAQWDVSKVEWVGESTGDYQALSNANPHHYYFCLVHQTLKLNNQSLIY